MRAIVQGQVEVVDVFEVITNTDLTEGRGHERVLAVCDAESTALRIGHGKYVQGHDCPIRPGVAIRVRGHGLMLVAGHVEAMTEDDEKVEEALARARVRNKRIGEIMDRLRGMGLSAEELDEIIQGLKGN